MSDVARYTGQQWRALGAEIKRRRVALGLSQQQLADAAGIGVNTVGNIESEDKARRELTLADICAALGWTRDSYLSILEGSNPTLAEPEVEPEDDALRYERPDDMDDESWAELKAKFDADYAFWLRFRRR